MTEKQSSIILFILFALMSCAFAFSQEESGNERSSPPALHEAESIRPEFDENYFFVNEPGVKHVKEQDNFQAKFLNMLFILTLLIGFMILASWVLKRMMKSRITQINQSSAIKVLETRQLSPKSALYLVEVEGRIILIAESGTSVNHIASFSDTMKTSIPPFPKSD